MGKGAFSSERQQIIEPFLFDKHRVKRLLRWHELLKGFELMRKQSGVQYGSLIL